MIFPFYSACITQQTEMIRKETSKLLDVYNLLEYDILWINIINNASSKKLTIYSHIESIYSIATTSFNHSPSYFIINKVGTQHNMLPFVHSELPFMHRGIEKYKDFVIFKVYYYILSILRIYNMEWR